MDAQIIEKFDRVYEQLDRIEKLQREQNSISKEVLNFNETMTYLDVSRSHLYKMTSTSVVPFYKPNGKKLYFKRSELDAWLLTNRHLSASEIDAKANEYLMKAGKAKYLK